jgi:hypothetical protein
MSQRRANLRAWEHSAFWSGLPPQPCQWSRRRSAALPQPWHLRAIFVLCAYRSNLQAAGGSQDPGTEAAAVSTEILHRYDMARSSLHAMCGREKMIVSRNRPRDEAPFGWLCRSRVLRRAVTSSRAPQVDRFRMPDCRMPSATNPHSNQRRCEYSNDHASCQPIAGAQTHIADPTNLQPVDSRIRILRDALLGSLVSQFIRDVDVHR